MKHASSARPPSRHSTCNAAMPQPATLQPVSLRLGWVSLLAVGALTACGVDDPGTEPLGTAGSAAAAGAAGVTGAGGPSGGQSGAPVAGALGTAGTPAAGAGATGGGATGGGATGGAGVGATGGGAGVGATGGGAGAASAGAAGAAGADASTGGMAGVGGGTEAGAAGMGPDDSDDDTVPMGDPNPSGLAEPGDGGQARPSGAAGNLQVLPWAGYTGAITYTFDDANSTQINNEAQLMGLEVPFTWYLQTGKQEASNDFYQRALDAGHELGNHTQQHGSGAADNDINQAQQFLMNTYGVTAYTMAAPNGSTGNYNSISQQLFIVDRGVNDSLIGPDDNTDVLNFPTFIPPTGAGTAQLNPKVDAAQSQGKWQTVCIHGFSGGSDGAYQPIDLNGFVQHVEYAKDKGDIWIGSMVDVGAYWMGRKAVAAAVPEASGDDQVYTWTIPAVFPPGRFVRVTVDGGTLSQDGAPLPWNEHGFYEVALDVGSLTLSP